MRIGLVACSKMKLARPAPARELYTSPLFRAASIYCEATYDRWLILSALHGLMEPDQVIEPYDVTLRGMPQARQLEWIARVVAQGLARGWRLQCAPRPHGVPVSPDLWGDFVLYLHAGELYRRAFWSDSVHVPLAGLGIGRQLQWYAERAREG